MKFDLDATLGWFIISSGIFVCLVTVLGIWEILDGILAMKLIITAIILVLVAGCTLAIRIRE